ncbi:MAG: hypothetical protein Q9173_003494 [Seirophora scorigena]
MVRIEELAPVIYNFLPHMLVGQKVMLLDNTEEHERMIRPKSGKQAVHDRNIYTAETSPNTSECCTLHQHYTATEASLGTEGSDTNKSGDCWVTLDGETYVKGIGPLARVSGDELKTLKWLRSNDGVSLGSETRRGATQVRLDPEPEEAVQASNRKRQRTSFDLSQSRESSEREERVHWTTAQFEEAIQFRDDRIRSLENEKETLKDENKALNKRLSKICACPIWEMKPIDVLLRNALQEEKQNAKTAGKLIRGRETSTGITWQDMGKRKWDLRSSYISFPDSLYCCFYTSGYWAQHNELVSTLTLLKTHR